MKQCVIALVTLSVAMFIFVMLLGAAGTVIRDEPTETVFALSVSDTPTQTVTENMTFPFLIPETKLVAQSLGLYEGELLELDSSEFVVDAAALEVTNQSDREVAFAYITLAVGEADYHFVATNLPAGSTSLLIEMEGKAYRADSCSACTAWVRYGKTRSEDENLLVTEQGMDILRLENISEKTLENVVLYYKNYLIEESLYLGGVTYQMEIGTLQPGQCLEISPFRYVSGYSKIIKAVPY